jgi:hypothetical protein
LTLGRTDRDVRVLGRAMVVLEDRLEDIAKLVERNPESPYTGADRRSAASFSDAQVEWLKTFHQERDEIRWGKVFLRLILYAAGAAGTATLTILVAYFKLKG